MKNINSTNTSVVDGSVVEPSSEEQESQRAPQYCDAAPDTDDSDNGLDPTNSEPLLSAKQDLPHQRDPCRAYSTLIGGTIYMMIAGSQYVTAVLQSYIQSYFQLPESNTQVQNLVPAISICAMFFVPIGSHFVQKNVHPRLMIAAAGIPALTCFFIASFMVEGQFVAFAILYVLGFAFVQGISYMVPVHHGWLWFPGSPGLVSGIIIGGFGCAPLVFDNMWTRVINPDNVPVSEDDGFYTTEIDDSFISTWRLLVACWAIIAITGFVMIYPGPAKVKEPVAQSAAESSDEMADSVLVQKNEATMSRMVFSQPFVVLYLMSMFSIISGYFAVNNYARYGRLNGLTDENYFSYLGSIASICNAIRFIWSFATDHYSYKLVYGTLVTMQIVLNFTCPLIAESAGLYAIWISLMLLCEGGHFTLVPNVLKKIYGDKGTALYGIAFSYTGICSILIVVLQTFLLTESAESYDYFFYANGCFSCISLVLLLTLFKEDKFIA